jgi:energy-coupling factor transport system permease protein
MSRLHPLSLIFITFWLSSAAVLENSPLRLTAVFIICLLFRVFKGDLALSLLLKQLSYIIPLMAIILLIQIIFVKDGALVWGRGIYGIHTTALINGFLFSLRMLILLFSAQMLLRLDYLDYEHAFHALRLPEEFGFMVFYALHTIPRSQQNIKRDLALLRMRGVDIRRVPLEQKIFIYKTISLSVLAEVISRSAVQATALELRGFRYPGKHTRLEQRSVKTLDYIVIIALILLSSAMIIF